MPLGSLGQLGGLFSGDSTAFSFKNDVDDVTRNLLNGGQGRAVGSLAAQQANNATQAISQQNTSNPALAARQGAQAGQQARVAGVLQGAQMTQQAQVQGANMAQQRIEAERARVGNALGAGLDAAGSIGAMMIPGAQAGAVANMAQSLIPGMGGGGGTPAPQAPTSPQAPYGTGAGVPGQVASGVQTAPGAPGTVPGLSDEEILRSLLGF